MFIDKKKKNAVIFFTLSPNSIRVLSCQLKALEIYTDEYNLIFVSTGKTKKAIKYFKEDSNLPYIEGNLIFLGKEIENIFATHGEKTYEQIAKDSSIHQILKDIKIDMIINWGSTPNKEVHTEKLLEIYKTSKWQTFGSTIGKLYPLYLIYTLLSNDSSITYIEHTIDPIYLSFTPNLPNKMVYLHENSTNSHKRYDAYQYYLLHTKSRGSKEKDINFIFGLTAINDKDRIELVQKLKEVLKDEKHFYAKVVNSKDKSTEFNTLLPREEYNKLVHRAKYTFIAPAYVKNAFSITRLCDTVYGYCCPIFDSRCNFDILKNDFGIDKNEIKDVIFDITSDSITYPSDEKREYIIEYLYEKMFTNLHLRLE